MASFYLLDVMFWKKANNFIKTQIQTGKNTFFSISNMWVIFRQMFCLCKHQTYYMNDNDANMYETLYVSRIRLSAYVHYVIKLFYTANKSGIVTCKEN